MVSRGRAAWHMGCVNTRLPGKLDGSRGHLPTESHSIGLSWSVRSRAKEEWVMRLLLLLNGGSAAKWLPRVRAYFGKKTGRGRGCAKFVGILEN